MSDKMSQNPDHKSVTGSCLCGAVQYEMDGPYMDFSYCHCERCRKAYGAAHAAHIFFDPKQFRWTAGQENITLFIHKDAEDYPRAFCKTCGAAVPRFSRDGKRMVVPAGALDQDPGIRPTKNIFWPMRAEWCTPYDELEKFDARPPGWPGPVKK